MIVLNGVIYAVGKKHGTHEEKTIQNLNPDEQELDGNIFLYTRKL